MRSSSLLGRSFHLRDHGRFAEALEACQRALEAAHSAGSESTLGFSTIVVGALTIDEIAPRLGKPDLAREPLEIALKLLERTNALRPDRPSEELLKTERRVRIRLDELRSGR